MNKKLLLLLAAFLIVPLGMRAQITTFPYMESFETDLGGWTLIDADGDGNNWTRTMYDDEDFVTVDGNYFVYSASYINNVGSLTPDNWLVSPEIVLGDDPMVLSWWTKVQDVGYPDDHYAVYVSTTGATVNDFTDDPIYEITLTSAYAQWVKTEVSLADYAGQSVHIAFRHFDCEDVYIFLIDAISIEAPAACTTPTSLAVSDITSNSATLTFDYASSWNNANIYLNGELFTTTTSGTVSLTNLENGTTYSVWVEGVCSSNEVSDQAVASFTTDCAVISEFPYNFGFETGNANCYDLGGSFFVQNHEDKAHSGSFYYYASTSASMPTMVTPTFQLPTSGDNYLFGLWVGSANASYAIGDLTFSIMVSTEEGEGYDESFVSLLDTFISQNNANSEYHQFAVPIGSYAGETVRFAVRYTTPVATSSSYQPLLYVDDYFVRDASTPVPVIDGPTAVDINTENVFTVSLIEGIEDGLYYEWTSARVEAGDATMEDNGDSVTIVYTAGDTDTITVVAHNTAGSMSATFYVHLRNCSAITTLPWQVALNSQQDIECWTIVDNDNDASTWQINNNGYLYEPYTDNSDDWAITPAIQIPENADGIILQWDDYLSTYNGGIGHYEVYVSPSGSTALNSFTDTVFTITESNNTFVSRTVSLSDYASSTIRIAFRHITNVDDNGMRLRNVMVRIALAPLISIDGSTVADVNTTVNLGTILHEGSTENITYHWTSTMAAAGDATLTGENDSVASIQYGATVGYDTIVLVVANAYGQDSTSMIVRVRDLSPVTELPYSNDFEDQTENTSWELISNAGINAWYTGSAAAHSGSTGLYVSSDGGQTNSYNISSASLAFAYRAFSFTQTGEYAISYDWMCAGESNYDFIRAFVIPTTTDLSTLSSYGSITYGTLPEGYVAIDGGDQLNESSTWQTFSTTFSITTPGNYNIVFCWRNDGSVGDSPAGAIDNVELSTLSCPRPTDVSANDITTTEATISWTAGGEESQWIVIIDDTDTATVSTTSYTATGLQSSSAHSVKVIAVCSDDDQSFVAQATFRTLCDEVSEFPWSEGFDEYAYQSFPDCWTRISGFTSGSYIYPYVTTYSAHTGAGATYDYLPSSPASMIATPMFATPANTLTGNLWVKGYAYYSTSSGTQYEGMRLEIGILADTADTSSFVAVLDTIVNTYDEDGVSTWEEITFSAESCGISEHAMVAFRVSLISSNATGYFYFDDITINNDGTASDTSTHHDPEPIPVVCDAPILGQTSATDNSITISWSGDAEAYEVSAVAGTGVQDPAITTTSTSYTFSQLEASTTYTISVRAVCNDTLKSDWASTTVSTLANQNGIEGLDAAGISVYPNPASEYLTVDLGDAVACSLQLFDQSGRMVKSLTNASGKVTLDVKGLTAGAYYLRVVDQQSVVAGRVVVR